MPTRTKSKFENPEFNAPMVKVMPTLSFLQLGQGQLRSAHIWIGKAAHIAGYKPNMAKSKASKHILYHPCNT